MARKSLLAACKKKPPIDQGLIDVSIGDGINDLMLGKNRLGNSRWLVALVVVAG